MLDEVGARTVKRRAIQSKTFVRANANCAGARPANKRRTAKLAPTEVAAFRHASSAFGRSRRLASVQNASTAYSHKVSLPEALCWPPAPGAPINPSKLFAPPYRCRYAVYWTPMRAL